MIKTQDGPLLSLVPLVKSDNQHLSFRLKTKQAYFTQPTLRKYNETLQR